MSGGRGRRLAFALLALIASAEDTSAICVRTGDTVSCTGATFQSFITSDTVMLTVARDALVANVPSENIIGSCPLSFPVIVVGPRSTVVNAGGLAGSGVCASGVFTGNGSTVRNDGFVGTTDSLAHGLDLGDDATVVHNGRISTLGQSAGGIFTGARARVTTGALSSIEATAANGIIAGSGSSLDIAGTITVLGTLTSGIESGGGSIVQRGRITATGRGSVGIRAQGSAVDIVNSGFIVAEASDPTALAGTAMGVSATGAGVTIRNAGSIDGQRHAIRLSPTGAASIANTGTLRTTEAFGFAPTAAVIAVESTPGTSTAITNSGAIIAAPGRPSISGGGGSESVINAGSVTGDIILGGGADALMMESGSQLVGDIDMGAGDDEVALRGTGTYGGTIGGAELLTKSGIGTWTLNGVAAAARSTVVFGGTLAVNGRVATPSLAVISGGTLTGTGIIAGSIVNDARVEIAAGAQLTATGDYRQGPDGQLRVSLSDGAAAPLSVGGAVTLAGTLDPNFGGQTFRGGETFNLMAVSPSAPVVSGQFDRIVGVSQFFLKGVIERAATGNVLRLRIARVPYASAAATASQTAVATALDQALAQGDAGLRPVFDTLDTLQSGAAATALDRLAPQLPAAVMAAAELSARTTAASLGLWLELGPADGVPGSTRAWGQAARRIGRARGHDGAGKFRATATHATAGLDVALGDGTRIGFAMAAQDGAVAALSGPDRASIDTHALAVYAGRAGPEWRFAGAVVVGDGTPAWQRQGFLTPLSATSKLGLAAGFATATYASTVGPLIVKPSATVNIDRVRLSAVTEVGAAGLTVERQVRTTVRPSVAVRAVSRPGRLHPYLAASLSYDDHGPARLAASFAASPATRFDLTGPRLRPTQIGVQAGVNAELGPGVMARVGFESVVNDPLADRGVMAGISYRW